jgi:vacuolar-type H+-ATPase subunit F/Vma7
MARAAVIGEALRVEGYALAGAAVYAADDEAGVLRAWQALPDDVVVVVLTARAAGWLDDKLAQRSGLLPVVMPV